MSAKLLVAQAALDSRFGGAEAVYTYAADADAAPGQTRIVPLGTRQALAWVISVSEIDEADLGFPKGKLRPLGPPIEGLSMTEPTQWLLEQIAHEFVAPLPVCLGLAAPPGVMDRLCTEWSFSSLGEDLTPIQEEVLRVLQEQGPIRELKKQKPSEATRRALLDLHAKGLVSRRLRVAELSDRARLKGPFRLTRDQAKIDEFLENQGRKRPAQAMTLMSLQGSESASFSIEELKALSGVTAQTLKALLQAGLLESAEEDAHALKPAPEPNPAQKQAIAAIAQAIEKGQAERFLLFGVTGSGKTEVYLRAASEALRKGEQVLYLVPEIALTAQVIAQLRARFGKSVAILHSGLNASERLENWLRIRRGEAPIVLGPRSALFAPFSRLGLIVMDEEHEPSYKQESMPRYHTRLAAWMLAQRHGCPIVYGSATPSIETRYEAEEGRIKLLNLPTRAASALLPEVHIEDLKEGYKEKRPSIFAPALAEAIQEALHEGHQAILFLNRRAYAPVLICRDCNHKPVCPNCAVTLALHRKQQTLLCHHCGHRETIPEVCPKCGSHSIAPFGVGVEKVEELARETFAGAVVDRLDRDVTQRKGALEEVLARFRSGESDILVGTQMVAKGLDFPNVTVVGVIAADMALTLPDFRASERTYQLLSQVAGRAGRGSVPGRVYIQTLSPDHPAIVLAKEHDFDAFYREMIEERREVGYPPFRRLINIIITGPNRQHVVQAASVAGQRLKNELEGAEILGPAPCLIERVQKLWRRHVLVKLMPDAPLPPVGELLEGLNTREMRVAIDVDPSSLL